MYKVILINDNKATTIHAPYFSTPKLQSGSVKQGINVSDSFTFDILPNNPGYNLIFPLKTLIRVENTKTGKIEFEGRVLMPSESMSESGVFDKSYICESELGYLNDSSQRHGEYHDITVKDFLQVIIDNHNRDVAGDSIDKTFKVGIVEVDSSTSTLYRYLGYESTFDTIKDKLLDRLGGELRVRKENGIRYLDYLESIGEYKSTEIRLAKNLKSITKEVDPTEIITRLIPLGERIESEDEEATDASEARLTIESVNGGIDFIDDQGAKEVFGVIAKSHTWDDISQPNNLMRTGLQYLKENNRVKSQHKISALDLSILEMDPDSFEVGNWHPVINPIMDINEDLRIIGKTTDIINPESNNLTIGDKFMTASKYQNEAKKSQRKIVDLENTVDRQSKRLATLNTELKNVDDNLESLKQAIEDTDLEGLDNTVSDLVNAVDNLNNAIDNIPEYSVATTTKDGIMSKEDKIKLNRITVNSNINLDNIVSEINSIKDRLDILEE